MLTLMSERSAWLPASFRGLFERDDYPVSAMALVPSEVFMLPTRQFHCLLEQAAFRREFIGNLLAKQRYLAEELQLA